MTNTYAIHAFGGRDNGTATGLKGRVVGSEAWQAYYLKGMARGDLMGNLMVHMPSGWDRSKDIEGGNSAMYTSASPMSWDPETCYWVFARNREWHLANPHGSLGIYITSHPTPTQYAIDPDTERIPFNYALSEHRRHFTSILTECADLGFDIAWLDNSNADNGSREWPEMAKETEYIKLGGEAIPVLKHGPLNVPPIQQMPWMALSKYIERHELWKQEVPDGAELLWCVSGHENPSINTKSHIRKAADNGWSIGSWNAFYDERVMDALA
jgi:hypothetical protein